MGTIISLCEQDFLAQLEQKDDELSSEKKNGVKRDKTIQGLTQLLKEKEKEVSLVFFFVQAGMLFIIGFKTVDVNRQNILTLCVVSHARIVS